MIAPLMVAGVGISMSFPAAQNSVVGAVAPEAIGKASGTNATMRELGGVLGIAIGVAAGLSLLAALAGSALPRLVVDEEAGAPQIANATASTMPATRQ
jgi:hypothetical protein